MKHSGLGIASFCISLFAGLIMIVMIVLAGMLAASGQSEDSLGFALVGLGIIGMGVLLMVALGLGIAGVCMRDTKKLFAILGLVFSAVGLLGVGGIMLIGILAEQ